MHSYAPLSPTTLLERSGKAFPKRVAISYSGGWVNYEELMIRARKFAAALENFEVKYGDRVALLSENTLHTIEAHFAIPAVGGVIVSINPWLRVEDIVTQLTFCGANVLIASQSFIKSYGKHIADKLDLNVIVSIDGQIECQGLNVIGYEDVLKGQSSERALDARVLQETDSISISFTSGTTGKPKGVVHSHRAAYLHAIGQVMMINLRGNSKYLWSLPMFHVNGWGHMWAVVAAGATQIIPHDVKQNSPGFGLAAEIISHGITHLSGAPRLVRNFSDEVDNGEDFKGLTIVTGGTAPSSLLVTQLENMNINLIHQYGLSETLGPYVVCEEQDVWKELPQNQRIEKKLRQGIATIHAGSGLKVVDKDFQEVPMDSSTLGEVVMAGNTVATGYYMDLDATKKAFINGWFRSGDMAVVHKDGYIEIKDRIKDLIYVETEYGWENVYSIEIENIISKCNGVKDIAVIGVNVSNDDTSKPVIVAFLEKLVGSDIDECQLKNYCDKNLAEYMSPNYFVFSELPKTTTGKIVKNILIDKARSFIKSQENIRPMETKIS